MCLDTHRALVIFVKYEAAVDVELWLHLRKRSLCEVTCTTCELSPRISEDSDQMPVNLSILHSDNRDFMTYPEPASAPYRLQHSLHEQVSCSLERWKKRRFVHMVALEKRL